MVWLEALKCILKCWSLWAAVTDERTLNVLNKRLGTLFLYRFSFEDIKRVIYWGSAAFNQVINSRIRPHSLRGCRTHLCEADQRKQAECSTDTWIICSIVSCLFPHREQRHCLCPNFYFCSDLHHLPGEISVCSAAKCWTKTYWDDG